MKTTEERMKIAKYLEGVDFVFEVNTKNEQEIEDAARKAYLDYMEMQKRKQEEKKVKH